VNGIGAKVAGDVFALLQHTFHPVAQARRFYSSLHVVVFATGDYFTEDGFRASYKKTGLTGLVISQDSQCFARYVGRLGKSESRSEIGSTLKRRLSKPLVELTKRANDENPRLAPWAPFFVASDRIAQRSSGLTVD
jgi:hypothetical protein